MSESAVRGLEPAKADVGGLLGPSQRWLQVFGQVLCRVLRDGGEPPNCCVVACRVGMDVARQFGFAAEPVPVAVRLQRGRQVTVVPGPDGRRGPGFAGHLVLYFPACDGLSDPTAGQFRDPRRGLFVPDHLYAWRLLPRAELTRGVEMDLPHGVTLRYQELVGDLSWRAVDAWTSVAATVAATVARQVQEVLAAERRPRRGRR